MKTPLLRLLLTIFICLISNILCGQFYSISDSLTSPNTAWSGDTAWMNFSSEGLRSAAPSEGSLSWRRPSLAGLGAEWRLDITMEFNPSSSNFCEFRFLENGGDYYAIQLGGNSADNLSLILHTTYKDSVLAFIPDYVDQSKPQIALKIERDTTAHFSIYDADSLLFALTDSSLMQSESLSIYARYTSSRVDKFLFSTLLAEGYDFPDTLGPTIITYDILSPFRLEVEWDEWCELAAKSNAYLMENGELVDTLTVSNHYDQLWHLDARRPLPRGTFDLILPPAVDAENNTSSGNTTRANINYPGPRSVWITAVHPFSNYGGHFIDLQSHIAITNTTLTVLEEDGDLKNYTLDVDSGLTRFSALKLPENAVLIIEKDGIILTLQPYSFSFAPHQQLGDFLLSADSLTALTGQFNPTPLSLYNQQWRPEGTLPLQKVQCFYADHQGNSFAHFSHSLWPYLDLLKPNEIGKVYDPLRPFLLPTNLQLPLELGDTTYLFEPALLPDTARLYLSEVHFHPDTMDEFIELYNPQKHPILLTELQLEKMQESVITDVRLLDPPLAPFNAGSVLYPLILHDQYLAVAAPFSLPNSPTSLTVIGRFGTKIDAMSYAPWDSGLYDKHSAERISFASSGSNSTNWSPHHHTLHQPSEASPNAPNSVSSTTPRNPSIEIALTEPHISYDPLSFQPTAQLHLEVAAGAKLSLSVHTTSGRLLATPIQEVGLPAGEHSIEIRPLDWHQSTPESGVYLLKVSIKDENGRQQKILPLSVYNP